MLAELSVKGFLENTASKDPVPGGGSIAALAAAMAAGLSEMVANRTMGRKGFEGVDGEMREIAREALGYRKKLLKDVDRDSEAYARVMAAFRLPKETASEKETRSHAIQEALKGAALVPMEVGRDALKIMDLAGKAVEKGNPNAVTDGAVAAMMARTAVRSALYNVKINLASIKDQTFVEELREEVDWIEKETGGKEKAILSKVNL